MRMADMMKNIRVAADKRRRFNTIRDEIRRMPLDVALDLDIHREDADRIARAAVYG